MDWKSVPLKDCGEWFGGGTPSKKHPEYWSDGDIRWITSKDMKSDVIVDTQMHINRCGVENSSARYIEDAAVLVVMRSGILRRTFPVAMADDGFTVNQDLKGIIPNDEIDRKYLFYALRANEPKILATCMKSGTTVESMDAKSLMSFCIPVPPKVVQKNIVARLEKWFKKIAAAEKKIAAADEIFVAQKNALLHTACTGKLTEEWREEKGSSLNNWHRTTVKKLCHDLQYGTAKKSQKSGDVPVVRMGNLQDGEIEWDDLVYSSDEEDIKKYLLHDGDVLFNRTNSAALVGKTSIYRGERPAIFAGYLIRLNYDKQLILGDFLNFALNTPDAKMYCHQVKVDGVNQSNINAKKIGAYEILLPPMDEQREIVRRLDALLSRTQRAAGAVREAAAAVQRLRAALLAKAFRGEV